MNSSDPEDFIDLLDDDMDVREILDTVCMIREDSKAERELVLDLAEMMDMDRETQSSYLNEFVSTVEVVEIDGGYVQTRRFFDRDADS
ncbi:MAG: hypothetical protein ABEK59_00730 [Halobacteria archaeon]